MAVLCAWIDAAWNARSGAPDSFTGSDAAARMARLPRLAVPGQLHLLVQQARPGVAPFDDVADRHAYLAALREAAAQQRVAVHAYGLVDAQARLLVTPQTADGLGRALQSLGRRFGAAYNRRHARTGGLWAARFRAAPVDASDQFLRCLRYVETDDALASTAPHHLGRRVDPLVTEHTAFWPLGNTPFEREARYARAREQALTSEDVNEIERALRGGWPLGSQGYGAAIQAATTRRMAPLPRGRKTVPV